MTQNRNNPRRPRYRKYRRHDDHYQEFLDRMEDKYLDNATEHVVTVVNTDLSFSATVSGSAGPYRVRGVRPPEMVDNQFYIAPYDSGGVDKAKVFRKVREIVDDTKKITFASRSLSLTSSGVDVTNDTIGVASHGLTTGEGPFQLTTTTTLPAGLATTTDYWAILNDPNSFKVSTTLTGSLGGTYVNITSPGTGTHSLDLSFSIEQDMTADGVVEYMGRGISRDTIKHGVATASGILEVFY